MTLRHDRILKIKVYVIIGIQVKFNTAHNRPVKTVPMMQRASNGGGSKVDR